MTVTKTWTFSCDKCGGTVETKGGGLPKGWLSVTRQKADGSELEHFHACSALCACSLIVELTDDKGTIEVLFAQLREVALRHDYDSEEIERDIDEAVQAVRRSKDGQPPTG